MECRQWQLGVIGLTHWHPQKEGGREGGRRREREGERGRKRVTCICLSSIPEFTIASCKPGLGVPAKQKLSKQPSDGTKEGAGTGKGVTMQQLKEDIATIQQNSECLTQVITLLLQVRKVWQWRGVGVEGAGRGGRG